MSAIVPGRDAIRVNAGGLRAVRGDHLHGQFEFVRQRELRHMRDHRRAFERIGLAKWIVGIVNVVLRRDDVDAAREQSLTRAIPRRFGSRSSRAEHTRLMCALKEIVMPAVATMSITFAA